MAITNIVPYPSNMFSFSADVKLISTEISTLAGPLVTRLNNPAWKPLYDTAPELVGFVIESEKTGRFARWYLDRINKDAEGDVVSWYFKATPETLRLQPQLRDWNVVVFND